MKSDFHRNFKHLCKEKGIHSIFVERETGVKDNDGRFGSIWRPIKMEEILILAGYFEVEPHQIVSYSPCVSTEEMSKIRQLEKEHRQKVRFQREANKLEEEKSLNERRNGYLQKGKNFIS